MKLLRTQALKKQTEIKNVQERFNVRDKSLSCLLPGEATSEDGS